MVICKHCGEEARFLRIDAGNFRDVYYCSECGRSGYLDVDFQFIEEENSMRECLAEYAHEAWSGWMLYLFENSIHNGDGTVTIPADKVDRWERLMNTDYEDLSEDEKESDRRQADRILKRQ